MGWRVGECPGGDFAAGGAFLDILEGCNYRQAKDGGDATLHFRLYNRKHPSCSSITRKHTSPEPPGFIGWNAD